MVVGNWGLGNKSPNQYPQVDGCAEKSGLKLSGKALQDGWQLKM